MAQKRKTTAKKSSSVKTKTARKKATSKRSKTATKSAVNRTKSVTHKKPEQTEWFLSWFEETPKKKSGNNKKGKLSSKRK